MLTDTMTPCEIRAEMRDDHDRLLKRLRHEAPGWRRLLLKHKGCVLYEHGEWISPQNKNRWLWGARIRDHRMRSVGLNYGILRYRQTGMEFLLYMPSDADYGTIGGGKPFQSRSPSSDTVCRFTPHSWKRVRERVPGMHRYYGRELVERILAANDNSHYAVTENPEAQNATGQQLENTLQLVTHHGAFLGIQVERGFIQFNTFISHRQTQGRQREIIDGLHQRIITADKI